MATCKETTKTMGVVNVSKEKLFILALMTLLGISMYTNDNCAVRDASEKVLQPFFYDPRSQAETWEK